MSSPIDSRAAMTLALIALLFGCAPEPVGKRSDAPKPETDLDGDGYQADEDCDDADAEVHPGATEVCLDWVDNDCDGVDRCDASVDADWSLQASQDVGYAATAAFADVDGDGRDDFWLGVGSDWGDSSRVTSGKDGGSRSGKDGGF